MWFADVKANEISDEKQMRHSERNVIFMRFLGRHPWLFLDVV